MFINYEPWFSWFNPRDPQTLPRFSAPFDARPLLLRELGSNLRGVLRLARCGDIGRPFFGGHAFVLVGFKGKPKGLCFKGILFWLVLKGNQIKGKPKGTPKGTPKGNPPKKEHTHCATFFFGGIGLLGFGAAK